MSAIREFRPEKILKPRGLRPPVLPGDRAVDLEIGCGAGWHPIRYAARNPDRLLIAIEHTRSRFAAFERRAAAHRLPNLLPVHADAVAWVTHALTESSIDRVFLLYPNPYPKKSDLNKRWHGMPFIAKLLEVLKPEGEVILATNERFYFEEAREYWTRSWNMTITNERELTLATASPRTHFEKKYLVRGDTCFELVLKK